MDAAEINSRWHRAIRRYHERYPEDAEWLARVNAALARCEVELQELEDAKMADKRDDKAPYTLMGRHSPGDVEIRIGTHQDFEDAREHADDAVDAGLWADVNVYDRDQKNVHAATKRAAGRVEPETEGPSPAA